MYSTKKELKKFLGDKKFKKIFVLTGKKSFTLSNAKQVVVNMLLKKKIKYYYKRSKIPDLTELKKIIIEIRKFEPDLILAIGGGSVIDYAKIANVVEIRNNLSDLIINYSYPISKRYTKLAVIPTTAGSGAEVTSNAVIYVDKIKYSFEHNLLIPDYFFLLPELVASASYKIKASSGFDAIAQALESIISQKSDYKSIKYASDSLKISISTFPQFLTNPSIVNSGKMLLASNLAGKAINISKTTAPHAISYPFTSIYNISHGHAVSLFFENLIKFNFDNLKKSSTKFDLSKRFDLIFKLFEVDDIDKLFNKIIQIKKVSRLKDNFNELKLFNIKPKKIIQGINLLRLKNNPVKISENELIKIIKNKT
tara:strand:+ start:1598 stop:2698 length:1101 start_codon:yes stop_codon:yes gene_type:complete